jgi:hypothetical protein
LEDELGKQGATDLNTLPQRMPTITFLDAAPSRTTLDQRPGMMLEHLSKEDALYP